jgi:single-strand DNA-binding protein
MSRVETRERGYYMPKSVNKVILVGNVGGDPEVKYTPNGTPVAKFSLATNESYKDKSGEWQDRVEWHNIVAWQRLAEIVGEYVAKGKKLYIEGRLQTSNWQDRQSGEKKYRTEIVARDIVLLGDGNGNGHRNAQQEPTARQPEPRYEHEINAEEAGISDEIPF